MEPTIYKPSIYKGNGIYKNGYENNFVQDYDPNTIYYAGSTVKHDGKFYLFNSDNIVTGNFDENQWKEVDFSELNNFIDIDFTADANDYAYCNFSYNPFIKILLAHINVKFTNQIQTSYNINKLSIRFAMPFVGYGASSGFAINSSNQIQYPQDSQVCCQLLDLDFDNFKSGVSFWTNGVNGIYGMFTSQIFAYLKTEKKNTP